MMTMMMMRITAVVVLSSHLPTTQAMQIIAQKIPRMHGLSMKEKSFLRLMMIEPIVVV